MNIRPAAGRDTVERLTKIERHETSVLDSLALPRLISLASFLRVVSWIEESLGMSCECQVESVAYIRKVSGSFRSDSFANVKSSRLSLSMTVQQLVDPLG